MSAATSAVRAWGSQTFRSLQVRNYKLFFIGQMISMTGTLAQVAAQAWLVLDLGGGASGVGLTVSLQFLPVLLFGLWGGGMADRTDPLKVLKITNIAAALVAVAMAVITITGVVQIWMVLVLALAFGTVFAVDTPARNVFTFELVGREHLTNAVTLTSLITHTGRLVGGAFAALIIAVLGIGACFVFNAISYIAVLTALVMIRPDHLFRPEGRRPAKPLGLRDSFEHVRSDKRIMTVLLLAAAFGTLAFEFETTLPLLAEYAYKGDIGVYGLINTAFGSGAVAGGVITAARVNAGPRTLLWATVAVAVLLLVTSAGPGLAVETVTIFCLGATSVMFLAVGNASLQLLAHPHLRGRVMALWSVAIIGSKPVGAALLGFVADQWGPHAPLLLGGVALLVADALLWRNLVDWDGPGAATDTNDLELATVAPPAVDGLWRRLRLRGSTAPSSNLQ